MIGSSVPPRRSTSCSEPYELKEIGTPELEDLLQTVIASALTDGSPPATPTEPAGAKDRSAGP